MGQLSREYPNVHIQTHVAENKAEVAWVKELFPESGSDLDVYQHHGLVRERSVLAHCVHLDDADVNCVVHSGAAIVFCPSSNLFLGSGLFDSVSDDLFVLMTPADDRVVMATYIMGKCVYAQQGIDRRSGAAA